MTARPIGSVTPDGHVTCDLCRWTTADRVDPVGALTEHRTAKHPDDQGKTPPATGDATAPRRDIPFAAFGAFIAIASGTTAYGLWVDGGWWTVPAVLLSLLSALGVYGCAESLQRRPRDRRGTAQTRK